MKKTFSLFLFCFISIVLIQAQSLDELNTMKTEKLSEIEDLQSKINGINGELAGLQKEIDILSGWRKGLNGIFGFDWNNSKGWIANPNPDSRSTALNIGITAFANADKEKTFWHNKGIIQKAWNDVDKSDADRMASDDGLFDNGTVDLLNISSLAGYKISEKLAISGLGELNTSLGNIFAPATLDLGIGATWRPLENLTVVFHPLNLHGNWWSKRSKTAFNEAMKSFDNPNFLFGSKIRVDYTHTFNIAGKNISWSSTFSTFVPYSNEKFESPKFDDDGFAGSFDQAGAFEYSWLNMLTFEVWKGIGVGLGWGLRNNEFESPSTQSYTTLGLSYGF